MTNASPGVGVDILVLRHIGVEPPGAGHHVHLKQNQLSLYTRTDIMITSGALGAGSRLGSSELWSMAGPEILKQIVK